MNSNHWRAIAILGGAALGFFYLAGYFQTSTTFPGTFSNSIYSSGSNIGINY